MKQIRHRLAKIILLSVLCFTSVRPPNAIANTFNIEDFKILNELEKRSLRTREELNDAGRAMRYQPEPSIECLDKMIDDVDKINSLIVEMETLMFLSKSMVYPEDEAIVNKQMYAQAGTSFLLFPWLRKHLSVSTAICAKIAVIVTKRESILNLITATENEFRQIANRVSNL
jgi:hypothetical protein